MDLHQPSKSLFSARYRLTGKPDYIVEQRGCLIPVEVKTGYHEKPEEHHVMQLIAYCQLVEDSYHKFTPYGILVYYDTGKEYAIPFNPESRFKLDKTIREMNDILNHRMKVNRNHNSASKCNSCSMRKYCKKHYPNIFIG